MRIASPVDKKVMHLMGLAMGRRKIRFIQWLAALRKKRKRFAANSQDSCQDFPPLFLTAFSIILENPEES